MTKQQIVDQMDQARENRDLWHYDREQQCHSLVVDDYTIAIKYKHELYYWSVEHARFGTIMHGVAADLISHARREAVEFARAHVLGTPIPKHA